ncbi:AF4/FMR2 family member 4-like isoform X1 [Dermacentor silvarum]|uniref:AF4/FMR2 family member 4-like isoform X1 n=1 Tax=Dermacentor silvarum TaxID=543639 RepID=UPI001897EC91|nr:AF4/FMR2 family member 4-like isoform X1 [Dermacentor silvarum]
MACNVTSSWGYNHFDPLWNSGASSVERDALRERERQARALRAGVGGGESGGHPIFRAPVKVEPGQEDELTRRIKNTLGDFSQVQRLLSHDPNHLIGISRTNAAAQARAPPAVSNPVNGSSSTASTWNGNATDPGGTRNSSSNSSSSVAKQQHHSNSGSSGSGGGSGSAHPASQSSSSTQQQGSSHHSSSSHRSHHGSSHHSHHHSHHHHKKQQPHQPPPLMNGQYKSSSSSSSSAAGKSSRHLSQPPQGSGHHHHHHHQSRGGSHEQGRLEDATSNPKANSLPASSLVSSSASTTNPSSAPLSQGPPNGLVVRPPAMRAPSKDVNNGNSSTSAQHQSSTNSSSSLTVRTESNGPATGSTKSSSLPRSSAADSKPKRPLPRLQISAPSSDSGPGSTLPELESILKEMKKVPPVLTAIETPRKEECRPYFPTSPVQDPVPNHLDESGDSKHLLDPRKVASPPGSSLQDDLEMSDSDDEQEPPFRKTSSSLGFSISKNPSSPNESILQPPSLVEKMSSSESSSSDSDDSSSASGSGSDSESSDSEGSAPETSREPSTQSWKLADLIEKRSSPAGLGAGLVAPMGRQSRAEDSLVDEDSFTPILSQYPNRDADLGLMLKSPSPQGLDLIRSPVTKPSNFLLSPVHSSPSRSPPPLTSHARAAPRSPSPQDHQPAPLTASVTAALSDDEGPCQMQNGRITMRLGKQQPAQPKSEPEPPAAKQQPEPVKRSWPSKAAKKETSPSLAPPPRNKTPVTPVLPAKTEPVEGDVTAREPTPVGITPAVSRTTSKRSHSDRYNEKRSKIHKPRLVLSDSSSDDEAPPPPSAVGRLSSSEDSRVDQRTSAMAASSRVRPPKPSRGDSKAHKDELVVPKREGMGMPRTPPEPPSLLSPIGQRSGSEVRDSAPATASSNSIVVSIALSRLLRLPGRLGRQQPSPSLSKEHPLDPGPAALNQKPDGPKHNLGSSAVSSPVKGKPSSKRKSVPDEDRGSREQEKKRRVSTSSSGSLRVKREPVELPRPDDESESRHAWPEPLRSCDSPSSLSSYSSQRSGSRQHRGRPSSSSRSRSEKGSASRRETTPSSEKSKRHHNHHREKKESSGSRTRSHLDGASSSSKSRAAPDDPSSDPSAMAGSTDVVSSSQVNSWEGLLSSSDQSEVHGHETPGSRMGSLGSGGMSSAMPVGTGGLLTAKKEEPADGHSQRGNPSQLLSYNSHREWESKNGSSDYFLCEAKRLKHEADREVHRTAQAVKYLEAVLYFILTGNAMEHGRADLDNVYRMYKETLTLIKHISSKFQKLQNDAYGSIDNKLAVLSLRCQSLLYKKLYELHKNDVRENMRALTEFQKCPLGKLASPPLAPAGIRLQRSPCQPSPHSPTPSPAGSVGSQSSGYSSCELASNGHGGSRQQPATTATVVPAIATAAAAPLPGAVALPQSQYLMLQRQLANLTCLYRCHELWEQADSLTSRSHSREFFEELDRDCGILTLHSSCSELVKYIQEGVCRLRQRFTTCSTDGCTT